MAATTATEVQVRMVTVLVKKVRRWFLLGGRGTVTLQMPDLVGKRVGDAMDQIRERKGWYFSESVHLNSKWIPPGEYWSTTLGAGDTLVLVDP